MVLFCFVFFPQELVEFYRQNSLKDCFKSLDTTLQFPYKEPERRAISKPPGRRLEAARCLLLVEGEPELPGPAPFLLMILYQMLVFVALCDVGDDFLSVKDLFICVLCVYICVCSTLVQYLQWPEKGTMSLDL